MSVSYLLVLRLTRPHLGSTCSAVAFSSPTCLQDTANTFCTAASQEVCSVVFDVELLLFTQNFFVWFWTSDALNNLTARAEARSSSRARVVTASDRSCGTSSGKSVSPDISRQSQMMSAGLVIGTNHSELVLWPENRLAA